MPSSTHDQDHHLNPTYFLNLALEHAKRSVPSPNAFCVGCIIVADHQVISTGYSRELPGNTHAEQCALIKLENGQQLSRIGKIELELYTTMEPCSIRLSGKTACTDTILDFNVQHPQNIIGKVYIGVGEPDDFVNCQGISKLVQNGIRVVKVDGLEEECLRVARRKE